MNRASQQPRGPASRLWVGAAACLLAVLLPRLSACRSFRAPAPPEVSIRKVTAVPAEHGQDYLVQIRAERLVLEAAERGASSGDRAASPVPARLAYAVDTEVPVDPDAVLFPQQGRIALSSRSSHRWSGLSAGEERLFVVQALKADGTPFSPPVLDLLSMPAGGDGLGVAVKLEASGRAFLPARIMVPAGAEVMVLFTNRSGREDGLGLYGSPEAEQPLFRGAPAGRARVYRFRAPEQPGTYAFRFTGKKGGPQGQLTVVPASQAAP